MRRITPSIPILKSCNTMVSHSNIVKITQKDKNTSSNNNCCISIPTSSSGVRIYLIRKLNEYKAQEIPYILVYNAISDGIETKLGNSNLTTIQRRDLQIIMSKLMSTIDDPISYDVVIAKLSDVSRVLPEDWSIISDILNGI